MALSGLVACTEPAEQFADGAVEVDAAIDAEPSCSAPTGAGTSHGSSVNAPETWTEAGSPHLLPFDTSLYAAVTLEPCAVVRIAARRTVTIQSSGALRAMGAAGRPVTIEAEVPGMAWATIRTLDAELSLTHTVIRGGGDPLNTAPALTGALYVQHTGAGQLHVDDVEIIGSLSQGVYLPADRGFDASSRDLRVHGAAGFPVHAYARVIGSIPSGDYTGNGRDAIAISGSGGPVVDAQTLHQRGVPYHVGSGLDGGRLDVDAQNGANPAVLTIEPGVTVQFPPGGTLNVEPAQGTLPARGVLIAVGTVAQPIVFTSDRGAAAAAGDWLGLGFGGTVDARSVLRHVRVEFAGGPGTGSNSCPYPGRVGQNDAGIRIFGPTLTQFITDTEIRASARDGIDRGWRADLQPDFLASNTFTAVAGCDQTQPRTAAGTCPIPVPCP